MPLEPEEDTGAALELLEEELPEFELLEEELPEFELLEDELPEDEPVLAEEVETGFLVPTVMTVAWAGVTVVRETSVLALSAPLVVVTS
jgi:hypothetical protein